MGLILLLAQRQDPSVTSPWCKHLTASSHHPLLPLLAGGAVQLSVGVKAAQNKHLLPQDPYSQAD